jgi:glycosyltransferase involved in cell wall biosynthesis
MVSFDTMHDNDNPLSKLDFKFLFLVWGSSDQGPRSRVMAGKLGIEVCFVHTFLPRGARYVPIKYPIQAVKTIFLLFRKRPQVIFVQNPPLLAVVLVYIYHVLTGAGYVVDAHSEALLSQGRTAPPTWIKSFLAKRAITTIVTNEHMKQMMESLGGRAFILRDVPTTFNVRGEYPLDGKFNLVVVNTFSPDEPLNEILAAAANLPDVEFYITGRIGRRSFDFAHGTLPNVHFTDFLPDEDYYSLLSTAQAVVCLTTRNHTMQRGACEALSLGKPIITSDWPILRQYFNKGTVHVDNTQEGICSGVLQMKEHLDSFKSGIQELQFDQQREWQEKIGTLTSLIKEHFTLKWRK